tara:strand:- start:209 stop:622 length:414 start_codon:yes stop_codon:yes gene_type:complete
MTDSEVIYYGDLKTESKHIKSGNRITTDAPTDNMGEGKSFSPTDLVATSLANCMLTVMGISAYKNKINITGTRAEVNKVMDIEPRRIKEIHINFYFPDDYKAEHKKSLENAAINCPVAKSLSRNLIQNIFFNYKSSK